jgi:TRAP-type transport system periplasmic protein
LRFSFLRRLVLTVGLGALILFSACRGPSDPAASPPGGVITLKYADQNVPGGWEVEQAAQPWLDQIQQATRGQVQITPYYSESLVKGAQAWDAVHHDIADMAWMFHGYWPERTPLSNVITLPLLPFKSARQASGIFWQLYQKYPALRAQFNENQVLLTWASTPYFLTTTTRQVRTLEDLKGLHIRVPNGSPVQIISALGALPVTTGMPDLYLYLDKGIIDGMATSWESLLSFRQYELVKYYTYIPLFTVYFTQAVNTSEWAALPPPVQDQINSVCGLPGSLFWGEKMFDSAEKGPEIVRRQGFEVNEYTLPPSELARWNAVAEPLRDEWVKKMQAAGYPEAQSILNTTLELIDTYQP